MEKSISWLEELLALQGLNASVSGSHMAADGTSGDAQTGDAQTGDDSYWLTIDTTALSEREVESLIGDRGKVLDSIQYLANITLNMGQGPDEQQAYTIEINGYRKKRQSELKALAEAAAAHVIETSQAYEIKGLSSAERRQVHGLLGDYEQLETFSRGREPERHLVVVMAGSSRTADSDPSAPQPTTEPAAGESEEE
jgi:spoIIIJ-associated protein